MKFKGFVPHTEQHIERKVRDIRPHFYKGQQDGFNGTIKHSGHEYTVWARHEDGRNGWFISED